MAWGARGRPPDGRLISPRRSRPRQRSSVGAICAGVTRTRNSSRDASRGGRGRDVAARDLSFTRRGTDRA